MRSLSLLGSDSALGRELARLGGELGLRLVVRDDIAGKLNIVISELSELGIIDTKDLGLLGGAEGKAGDEVHDEEDDAGAAEGVGETSDGVSELVSELDPVTSDPASGDLGGAIEVGNVGSGEDTGEEVTDDTANTVLSEDIKSVVDVDEELELGGVVAGGASDNTVDDSSPGSDETRAGSDGDETSNDTGAEADGRPLLLKTVVEETPGDTTNGSSNLGDDASHDTTEVSREGGTTVEAEPADPEEDCAEDNVGDVVGTVVELVGAVAATLSEHEGVGEGSGAGRDMDGSSSGEIETTHVEDPAGRVPRPARKRIVDDGGPDKHEDDARKHAAALSSGTNGEGNTGNRELVFGMMVGRILT